MNQNTEKAKLIISKIIYLTIATYSHRDRKPWITPVFTAFDEKYNFYWTSAKNSIHSVNLLANNEVAIVIYDSTVPEGTGEGVYMEALAYELEDEAEIGEAEKLLSARANRAPRDVFDFVDNSPLRIYKVVPQKVWMNTEEKSGGQMVDGRLEINLFL